MQLQIDEESIYRWKCMHVTLFQRARESTESAHTVLTHIGMRKTKINRTSIQLN